jgi:transposase
MTGARLVHDTLEQEGWSVEIADAQKVKGLAPLACKTDKIDSLVLAVLSQRDLVPAIWLPDPHIREERELARFRLHLVKHKTALKNRVHSTLINFGRACPVTDLFGAAGRRLLEQLEIPEPWRSNVTASVVLIDHLEGRIAELNRRLRDGHADHPYIPLLLSAPGIGWVLAFTIAAEIGEIKRFSSPQNASLLICAAPRCQARPGSLDPGLGWGVGALEGVSGVRAGALPYLGPRPDLVSGRRHDGSRFGKRCGRSVYEGRPRVRGGRSMSGAGRGASA